jgi:meiotically up-regulated gene 157 (Mug157) protein
MRNGTQARAREVMARLYQSTPDGSCGDEYTGQMSSWSVFSGGPHVGVDKIWPLGVIVQALTATGDEELKGCIETLRRNHADTGCMHEAFHKDGPKKFTRSWFAWANTIFGELLWNTYQKHPKLLD